MLDEELCSPEGCGKLGEGNKVYCVRKSVNDKQDYHVTIRGGSPVIKSRATWDQGLEGTGNGGRSPARGRWEAFPLAQTEHKATNPEH